MSTKKTIGDSYLYIARYAEKMDMSVYTACLQVLSETEKVLNLIMDRGKEDNLSGAEGMFMDEKKEAPRHGQEAQG
ncbi:MAG: hypothetical protein V1782_13990 [Pseudomonadota bacterium]